jgi:cysteine-rich repeat protein
VGGDSQGPGASIALARYDSTGNLDPTFGNGGTLYEPGAGSFHSDLAGARVGAAGEARARWRSRERRQCYPFLVTTDFSLARLGADGATVDVGVRIDLGTDSDLMRALVLQPDSKVVAVGRAGGAFALARYDLATCGDGVIEPSEQCDDGNLTSGDGCDANCTPTGCGNGVVTAGETCDDGNTLGDDCCSPTCQLDAGGMPCPDDGDTCRDDICDGAGHRTHPFNAALCDDGAPARRTTHAAQGSAWGRLP